MMLFRNVGCCVAAAAFLLVIGGSTLANEMTTDRQKPTNRDLFITTVAEAGTLAHGLAEFLPEFLGETLPALLTDLLRLSASEPETPRIRFVGMAVAEQNGDQTQLLLPALHVESYDVALHFGNIVVDIRQVEDIGYQFKIELPKSILIPGLQQGEYAKVLINNGWISGTLSPETYITRALEISVQGVTVGFRGTPIGGVDDLTFAFDYDMEADGLWRGRHKASVRTLWYKPLFETERMALDQGDFLQTFSGYDLSGWIKKVQAFDIAALANVNDPTLAPLLIDVFSGVAMGRLTLNSRMKGLRGLEGQQGIDLKAFSMGISLDDKGRVGLDGTIRASVIADQPFPTDFLPHRLSFRVIGEKLPIQEMMAMIGQELAKNPGMTELPAPFLMGMVGDAEPLLRLSDFQLDAPIGGVEAEASAQIKKGMAVDYIDGAITIRNFHHIMQILRTLASTDVNAVQLLSVLDMFGSSAEQLENGDVRITVAFDSEGQLSVNGNPFLDIYGHPALAK